jgi:ADP-heptose:LPS heptosyltransferase
MGYTWNHAVLEPLASVLMSNALFPLSLPLDRIVVVRALPGLGDFLCAVPGLRALRQALPASRLTLIGLPRTRDLAMRFSHYIDEMIDFPGFPGIPEQPLDVAVLPDFFAAMHRRRFDLALQFHGSGTTSTTFTLLLGARQSAGYYPAGQSCPDERLFLPYDDCESEVQRLLRLIAHLGFPAQNIDLEFPLSPADRQELAAVPEARDLEPGSYACLHPGASAAARRWPAQTFARLADSLAARGLRVVLTGVTAEIPLAEQVVRAAHAPLVNLAGRTSLGALAALVQAARLVICNDTGISHLAAAFQVPSVVLFAATDPARWAPLDRQLHRVVHWPLTDGAAEAALAAVLAEVDLLFHTVNRDVA